MFFDTLNKTIKRLMSHALNHKYKSALLNFINPDIHISRMRVVKLLTWLWTTWEAVL